MNVPKSTENYSADRLPPAIHAGETPFSSSDLENSGQLNEKENGGETIYSCEFCNKTGFLTYNNLQYHMIIHSAETCFSCGICKRRFKSSYVLTQHMLKHSREVMYHCKTCGREYVRKCAFFSHIKKMHGINTIGNDDIHTTIQVRTNCDSDRYKCAICGRSYSSSYSLQEHKFSHTGEKPWTCEICGKSFASSTKQARHIRIHTGDLPYSCDVCDKRFAQSSARKSHMRIHTGERPYSCHICGKSYSHNVCLKAHMAVHKESSVQ